MIRILLVLILALSPLACSDDTDPEMDAGQEASIAEVGAEGAVEDIWEVSEGAVEDIWEANEMAVEDIFNAEDASEGGD